MKICGITNVSQSMNRQNIPQSMSRRNNPQFKGLWGEGSMEVLEEPAVDYSQLADYGTSHILVTKVYYPFADETQEQIDKVVSSNTGIAADYAKDRDIHPKNDWAFIDVVDYIQEWKVKVMPKLDITAKQYEDYKNRDLLSKEEMYVSDCLKLAKLKQYLV